MEDNEHNGSNPGIDWFPFGDEEWQVMTLSTARWMMREWFKAQPRKMDFGNTLKAAQMRAK